MTVRNDDAFRRSLAAGFDGLFDWDFLIPAVAVDLAQKKTGITPMDFDCVIEKNGQFLVFETKSPGAKIPTGQMRSLEAAVRTGRFLVIVLWTKTVQDISCWDAWSFKGGELIKAPHHGDAAALVKFCRTWFEYALRGEGPEVNHAPYLDADGNLIHNCLRCGRPALFGFGVFLNKGKLGSWYCRDHRHLGEAA